MAYYTNVGIILCRLRLGGGGVILITLGLVEIPVVPRLGDVMAY